jgi:hypothetical protein
MDRQAANGRWVAGPARVTGCAAPPEKADGRPDPKPVLAELKDFQRQTVDYVVRRLYDEGARRFLIADEVGLGKTLVARGVIAEAIDRLWSTVGRIDVVYICSNAEIARQNIKRLNLRSGEGFELASRITLLPLKIHQLKENRLNFVSFTPGTSFDPGRRLGWALERALLYVLLRDHWALGRRQGPLKVLRGTAGLGSFRNEVAGVEGQRVDHELKRDFLTELDRREEGAAPGRSLRERFLSLSDRVARLDAPREHDAQERNELVAELRQLLASVCVQALEPDLVILDEFQRFRQLLEGESEASELAHSLFNYRDEVEGSMARVLLLSATPYRMYTLADESDEDHYADLLGVLNFLYDDPVQTAAVTSLLAELRQALLEAGDGNTGRFTAMKTALEHRLRQVMVRTERLASSGDRNGMLEPVQPERLDLEPQDLRAYVADRRLARLFADADAIKGTNTIEYWKSAPYLLNFMESYEMKRAFKEACADGQSAAELLPALDEGAGLLPWAGIRQYAHVDPSNARMRSLASETLGLGAWRLLWVHPSLPYYESGPPYDDPGLRGFTKRLVFSSWNVVPKAIAGLMSYEAERLMVTALGGEHENSAQARAGRRPLLNFASSEGRPTGMPVMALIYPSPTLARTVDPLALAAESDDGGTMQLDTLESSARTRVQAMLDDLDDPGGHQGPEDERWYWAAPLLLDLAHSRASTLEWWGDPELAARWSSGGEDPAEASSSRFADHVELAREVLAGHVVLGRRPTDLAEVVTRLALAAPGTGCLRAFGRVCGGEMSLERPEIRHTAASAAWSFRTLFNQPEVTTLVRSIEDRPPYWRGVLEYCLNGNLQAMLDEHVHGLFESRALGKESAEKASWDLAEQIRIAVGLRTTRVDVDDIRVAPGHVSIDPTSNLRTRFALRYGEAKMDAGGDTTHAEVVRVAFNSPFWPFLLASTSVGQEGLDFHTWCHAVVHWNLPPNPVDLEQREGRVHRYKGHAVRKNVASAHRAAALASSNEDPWEAMFAEATVARPAGENDIVPYWLYPGPAKIERRILALPLSREAERVEHLLRSLTLYRMVFGQPRQEDLVGYLARQMDGGAAGQLADSLRVDLAPR